MSADSNGRILAVSFIPCSLAICVNLAKGGFYVPRYELRQFRSIIGTQFALAAATYRDAYESPLYYELQAGT